MTTLLQPLLDLPAVSRTRRNHALEHATIHLLSERLKGVALAGRSDSRGFFLIGDLPIDAVADAAHEALARLRAGQRELAIHPNCGTNFLAAGMMAGLAAFVALHGADRSARARLERLPTVFVACTMALMLTHPLGAGLQQRFTTCAEMGDLRISEIRLIRHGRPTVHRVLTATG
ncbi:MAG: hypothetical protein HY784_10945 [Chloroflexi bacterium]|nr:hypothetical protein [Chloroflexota bacterium]